MRSDKQLFKALETDQLKVVVKSLAELVERDDFIHRGKKDEVYTAVLLHRKARSEYHERIDKAYGTTPSNGSPLEPNVAGGQENFGQDGLNV